jgi:hypothetical protein
MTASFIQNEDYQNAIKNFIESK